MLRNTQPFSKSSTKRTRVLDRPNIGIQHASGKYLWLIDADNRVRPNCVKSLIDALEAHNADQIIFPFIKAKKLKQIATFL